MNRDQLDQRHTTAIRRHYRDLTDTGQPPAQLLDELAAIADEHAQHIDSTTLARTVMPPSEIIPVAAEHAEAPGRPAPRRTAARRSAK